MSWEDGNDDGKVFAITNDEAAAEYLRECVYALTAAQDELNLVVGMVKAGGWSWSRVADVLSQAAADVGGIQGATKQAMSRRYAPALVRFKDLVRAAEAEDDDAAAGEWSATREFKRLARRVGGRPSEGWYEVRTSRRPTEGRIVSKHRKLSVAFSRGLKAKGYVFAVDPRSNIAKTFIPYDDADELTAAEAGE